MKFQTLRGMKDIMPEEMALRNFIYEKIRKVAENYGYGQVEPPAMESAELLLGKDYVNLDQVKELYIFKDQGGRKIGLRYDPTAPIARMVASNPRMKKPLKWYYISRMWRYERPQKGRQREFWQFGLECMGTDNVLADAEVIAIATKIWLELGFKKSDFKVFIGDRKILNEFAKSINIKNTKDVFRIIDKKDKISKQEFVSELKKAKLNDKQIKDIQKLVSMKGKPIEVLKKCKFSFGKKYFERLEKLFNYLKEFGVLDQCILDLGIVRGFAYYTDIVFEAFETDKKGNKLERSRFGGGRYDKLIEKFGGESTPATGFGIGIESTLVAMQNRNISPKIQSSAEVLIIPINEKFTDFAVQVAEKVREKTSCEVDVMKRNLKKEFDYAKAKNIKKVIVVGEKEKKSKQVTVKDLKTGNEKKVSLSSLPNVF